MIKTVLCNSVRMNVSFFSSMPFSPLVAGALKLFSQMMINEENRVEEMADDIGKCLLSEGFTVILNSLKFPLLNFFPIVGFIGRFLNLVFLDLLQHQRDPRALCHLMTKYLVQDDLVKPSVIPSHTKVLLRYLMQWCPMGKESTLVRLLSNFSGVFVEYEVMRFLFAFIQYMHGVLILLNIIIN